MGERAPKGSKLRISRVNNGTMDLGDVIHLRPDPPVSENLGLMNKGKVGRPFKYDDCTITTVVAIKYLTGVSYRAAMEAAAVLNDASDDMMPDFTTLCKRMGTMNITLNDEAVLIKRGSDTLRLVPEDTGIVPSSRAEWARLLQEVRSGKAGVVLVTEGGLLASRVISKRDDD